MKKIALIVRGKVTEDHDPDLMAQHADVVLSNGSPIGYFGEGGTSPNKGMFMNGVVYDYEILMSMRPYYVDANLAKSYNVVSTICQIEVSPDQAKKFDYYWKNLTANAKKGKEGFNLLGDNCSTHASEAFIHAGLLKDGIPGLDTPQNLYEQLKAKYGPRFACKSGFVGFKKTGMKFETVVLGK